MKKASSMSKDGNNLSKSCFGCYFCIFVIFGLYGLLMVSEQVEEVLFLIWNIRNNL